MPLTREMTSQLPHLPGVYIFLGNDGVELYVGKAKDLRKRVGSYISTAKKDKRIGKLVAETAELKYVEASDEIEALIIEARLIRELRPHFNRALKNSDFYPFLEITLGEDFPRVIITRAPADKKSRFIGPFTEVSALRIALRAVQPVFRFRTCALEIRTGDKFRYHRHCLNYNLRLCDAPCAGRISREEYRKKMKALIMFFSGGKKKLITQIERQMRIAAKEFKFEEATVLRDQAKALKKLAKPGPYQRQAVMFIDIHPQDALRELQEALNLRDEPARIEGYDISNLGELDAVGSRVTFLEGIPYKAGYRRYRIKTVPGQNDYAMLAEVLRRRIKRVMSGEDEAPSLILIDGGQGQVNAVSEALEEYALGIPVVGLAKKEEVIHFTGGEKPLKLPRNSQALRLLQQVRDESHRFAQQYHHLLRAKRVFGSGFKRHRKKKD